MHGPCASKARACVLCAKLWHIHCPRTSPAHGSGAMQRQANFPHTSYCTLHTSHLPSHFTLHLISDHVSTSQSSLYYKACTKHFRVLLCATKLAPRSTFYYKDWIKHFPVLLCGTKLAQSILNIILYHKACTEHFPVLLCTTKLAPSTTLY